MIKHNFKKRYGQNFLKSSRFVDSLLDPMGITESDLVIEIGPGDGSVTKKVIEKTKNVMLIEIDDDLIPYLTETFGEQGVKVVHQNVLDIKLTDLIEEHFKKAEIKKIKITGSLPYNVSKKIIRKFLTWNFHNAESYGLEIECMSFIVQDEVAKLYSAKQPRSTFLSTVSQIYAKIKKLESIPASQFHPRPKVDGGIIFFNLEIDSEVKLEDISEFEKFIKIAFSSPRKTLFNNLKNSNKYNSDTVLSALEKIDVSAKARPAELSFEQWLNLFESVKTVTKTL